MLELRAREHTVGDVGGGLTLKNLGQKRLDVGPREELGRDPLGHLVVCKRPPDRLGHGPGEHPIDRQLDLGERQIVDPAPAAGLHRPAVGGQALARASEGGLHDRRPGDRASRHERPPAGGANGAGAEDGRADCGVASGLPRGVIRHTRLRRRGYLAGRLPAQPQASVDPTVSP